VDYASLRFGPFLFRPLSVYTTFRFDQKLIMPLSFLPLSFLPLSCLTKNVLCLFPFCLFPLCPFPFWPLSVSAPFRFDGKCRLCRIPLCQLPRPCINNRLKQHARTVRCNLRNLLQFCKPSQKIIGWAIVNHESHINKQGRQMSRTQRLSNPIQ
jgi:hypothetical protein